MDTENADYVLPGYFHTNITATELPETELNLSTSVTNNSPDSFLLLTFGLIDGVLMLAIIFGNILVILAVKLSRKLSGVTSCKFILNLAVCDFFVGLTIPYHLAFYLVDHVGTEKISCILRFVLISFACTSSILNLILIAIDRYIAILHPLHYTRYMTHQMANVLMTCGWLVAFTVATMLLYWNSWVPGSECELEKVMPKYFVNLVLTPLFMAIWITMFTLYFRIWREAYGHAKRLRNFQNGTASDWKSMQMVLVILGCFTICWLPFLVILIYKRVMDIRISSALYEGTFTLAISNSCMNPVIYAWKNSNFRTAFCCLLKFKRPMCDNRPNFITNHIPAVQGDVKGEHEEGENNHTNFLHANTQIVQQNLDNTFKDLSQKHKPISIINKDTIL